MPQTSPLRTGTPGRRCLSSFPVQRNVSQRTVPSGDSGPSREAALAAEGLSAAYGSRKVFRDISFSISPGELTAVIGPNGSGKTTLLQALCGIHRETEGAVRVAGRSLGRLSRREIARHVAFVPQSSGLDFHITVEDAIALGRYPWLGAMAPFGDRDHDAVESALAVMALEGLRHRPLQTLSGGERQRVLLARALAQETPILLLDEPAASLDLRYQQGIFLRLKQLAATGSVAILIAEHQINLPDQSRGRHLRSRLDLARGPPVGQRAPGEGHF